MPKTVEIAEITPNGSTRRLVLDHVALFDISGGEDGWVWLVNYELIGGKQGYGYLNWFEVDKWAQFFGVRPSPYEVARQEAKRSNREREQGVIIPETEEYLSQGVLPYPPKRAEQEEG